MTTIPTNLTAKDFKSDQEVRWCPGCGDYAILVQMQKILADVGAHKHNTVFVSGIGCSSRFPYYLETFGLHGIHGRAPAIATGVKCANPDLHVWVITGDGDGLSIGGNHLIHALRRNVGLKIILFNNRIYGLTKGQYSPTSELGKKTKSSPYGTVDYPFEPVAVALAAGATFVARTLDVDVKHQQEVLRRAAEHEGSAFVEIYQDCNVYNHAAFEFAADRHQRPKNVLYLRHGEPLVYGEKSENGVRLKGLDIELVKDISDADKASLLVHDETADSDALAYLLSRLHFPGTPEPMGVFRAVKRPAYEQMVVRQIENVRKSRGNGSLQDLFNSGDTWEVGADPSMC